jgi:uracil-DNA glycosylase
LNVTPFDPGYTHEPFLSLCRTYPGADVYPPAAFRTEWGPIFHRGRLDGSARVLVIGQDPAQHEAVARRVLVGAAGHRLQGFLAKLGIDRSYVIVNTFLYSAFNQQLAATHVSDPGVVAYRHQWLDALLVGSAVQAVVALGNLADTAWQTWKATPNGAARVVAYRKIVHPTAPRTTQDLVALLQNWNAGLQALRPAIENPDAPTPLVLYGTDFTAAELVDIPADDMPAGLPSWMQRADAWAARLGDTPDIKRRTIQITVPDGEIP